MDPKKIHEILRNKIIHLEMEPEHIINVSDLALVSESAALLSKRH